MSSTGCWIYRKQGVWCPSMLSSPHVLSSWMRSRWCHRLDPQSAPHRWWWWIPYRTHLILWRNSTTLYPRFAELSIKFSLTGWRSVRCRVDMLHMKSNQKLTAPTDQSLYLIPERGWEVSAWFLRSSSSPEWRWYSKKDSTQCSSSNKMNLLSPLFWCEMNSLYIIGWEGGSGFCFSRYEVDHSTNE